MRFQYDDGGRRATDYHGATGDCVVRAIAIATGNGYQTVYDALNVLAQSKRMGRRKRLRSNSRLGVYRITFNKYMRSTGWMWMPTMFIGSGCRVHLREDEYGNILRGKNGEFNPEFI